MYEMHQVGSERTHCLRYSLLRARLFGSRPGGGFPTDPADCEPAPQFAFVPVHEGGRVVEVPFGARSEGRGESVAGVSRLNMVPK